MQLMKERMHMEYEDLLSTSTLLMDVNERLRIDLA
jgi:hypothetical protein